MPGGPCLALLALFAALVGPVSARAGPAPSRLSVDWRVDVPLTVAAGAAWITSEALKPSLAPERCRWCARNGLDTAVTRALAWPDLEAADAVGNVGGFVALPLVAAGALALAAGQEGELGQIPADLLLVVEAVALSSALDQLAKFTLGRERPFVADLSEPQKRRTAHPSDNNLSFYSGHANLAFATAVAAGTVAHLRGYRLAPLVWAVGLPLAAGVAYSRIAAEKHYLTDVLAGTAAGAAFGLVLPWLHRERAGAALALRPLGNGLALSFRF